MCFFIIPIPIGAYTIHSGSSAVVAMVSYVFLSLVITVAYVGCRDATFGPKGGRIRRWVMALLMVHRYAAAQSLYAAGGVWKARLSEITPTIGRDIVFIVGMYAEISLTMLLAYAISQLLPGRKEVG